METITKDTVTSDPAGVGMSDLHNVVGALRENVAGFHATQEYPSPADVSVESFNKSLPSMLKALFVWLLSKDAYE